MKRDRERYYFSESGVDFGRPTHRNTRHHDVVNGACKECGVSGRALKGTGCHSVPVERKETKKIHKAS